MASGQQKHSDRRGPATRTSVAFDLRDPVRSGIARVARSMARAFAENDAAGRYELCFCGPTDRLAEIGAGLWSATHATLVPWNAGRLSLREHQWPAVSRAVGDSVWYFPHWDMPWLAKPRRSVVLLSDVIPLNVPGAVSPARRAIAWSWIRATGLKATRLTVSTEFTRREVLTHWPDFEPKLRVIPLGVDPLFFAPPSPAAPELQRLVDEGPYMISVGNQKPHKNLVMGPEVLARVPDIRWIVVGERFSGWSAVKQRADRLRVSDRIRVLPPLPDASLHSLYASATCLFFPSRNEGFGLPLLEALASGTRVVAGAAGASIEVAGGYAEICDLDEADAFAAAVAKALTAGPLGSSGKTHASQFTWARSATLLSSIVDEISG
jgi:glycosyltransferase involved in cell wall biosynthesis